MAKHCVMQEHLLIYHTTISVTDGVPPPHFHYSQAFYLLSFDMRCFLQTDCMVIAITFNIEEFKHLLSLNV